MNGFDGLTIEITNWDKYNPRKDLKVTSWVRLQNSLFEDPSFIEFNQGELLFWVYLLSMVSKKQSGQIKFSLTHAIRIGRFNVCDVDGAFTKLIEMDCVRIIEGARTQTLRACNVDDTLRDERNVTNETNEQKKAGNQNSGESEISVQEESEVEEALQEEDPPSIEKKLRFNFEAIYQEYPRKDGKQQGLRICKARIKNQEDYDKLLCAVRRYRAQCDREGTEKQFIKHFSTFMFGDKWKDWLEPDAGTSTVVAAGETDWSKVFAEEQA